MDIEGTVVSQESAMENLIDKLHKRLTGCHFDLTPKMDREFLAKFIRAKKCNIESAAVAFQKYYAHIFRNIRRLEGIKPSHYVDAYASKTVVILNQRVNGSRILMAQVQAWDPSVVTTRELQDAILLLCEELLKDMTARPYYGGIILINLAGLNFSHLKKCTPSEIKYTASMALEGLPGKIAGIHILNAPMIYWPLHKLVMKFLPEKIRKKVHLHNTLDSLHRMIPKHCLPDTYGGNMNLEEAIDSELLNRLIKNDSCYEEYWSGATSHQPRRLSRKRLSITINQ